MQVCLVSCWPGCRPARISDVKDGKPNIEKCFLMVKYNDKYVGYMKTCKDGIYVHKSSNMVCLVDI